MRAPYIFVRDQVTTLIMFFFSLVFGIQAPKLAFAEREQISLSDEIAIGFFLSKSCRDSSWEMPITQSPRATCRIYCNILKHVSCLSM